ncbi:hypothetical protein RZN22_13140 [Bacillaceae bacterium S4-13-58]
MNLLNGILATALAFTGGAGLSMFGEKEPIPSNTEFEKQGSSYEQMFNLMSAGDFENMQQYMEEGNVNLEEMFEFMEEGNLNFGQMKSFMSEMHPNLNNQDLEQMYKGMHGTGGSSQSSNFRGMGNM